MLRRSSTFNRSVILNNSSEAIWLELGLTPLCRNDSLNEESHNVVQNGVVVRKSQHLSARLRPTLRLLQLFCFFPDILRLNRINHSFTHRGMAIAFVTIVIILLNGSIFGYTIKVTSQYIKLFGNLHASSVSSIITGIKPLINCVNMAVFFVKFKKHKRLLKKLDKMDEMFQGHFKSSPKIERFNMILIIVAVGAALFPLVIRIIEMEMMQIRFIYPDNLFLSCFTITSLPLVPLLSLWNVFPVAYYDIMNRIVRFWCIELRKHMKKELITRKRNLRFYYEQFNIICQVQKAMGNLFNPFILFSVGWTMFALCLTIYFCTQATSTTDAPPDGLTDQQLVIWNRRVMFNIIYSLIQIAVALGYIITICQAGSQTNEMTRKILDEVLSPRGIQESEVDQFQVAYFVHKMSTQFMWGMTVWQVFPIERNVFFTLVSLIITYAIFLLKLKDFGQILTPEFNSTASF